MIAALAAGAIAPFATLVLIVVTLAGALPVYRRVAQESPHGAGSIAMLARLLPRWGGKLAVLALLGFAATDFMITMTLSAADATAHLVENPLVPAGLQGREVLITLLLLAALGAVFLRGFSKAIRIATVLVAVYLAMNLVVIVVCLAHLVRNPIVVGDWWTALTTQHGNPLVAVAIALVVFPKLALGLSGFDTGVAVMPQVRGDADDTEEVPHGRIRGAQRLLTTAALIMSGFLLMSSLVTVTLIPAAEFQAGGAANGRALAYLAHAHLGTGFGTAYDAATIAILWFAGASAMAGLLNLVPRYLPRYGMAPEWTRATRPLVLAIAFTITIVFRADVDAQGGAYATGMLVIFASAALAVALVAHRRRQRGAAIGFGLVTAIVLATTVANVIERPDGIRIAALFIVGIVLVSIVSRAVRSTELRATSVRVEPTASALLSTTAGPDGRLITHELVVHGAVRHGVRVLTVRASSAPNAIAAVALHLRDREGRTPHIYFRWSQGSPIADLLRFLLLGEGEVASMTREVLREAEPDLHRRPWVHVA